MFVCDVPPAKHDFAPPVFFEVIGKNIAVCSVLLIDTVFSQLSLGGLSIYEQPLEASVIDRIPVEPLLTHTGLWVISFYP